jgi:hypothetical protein
MLFSIAVVALVADFVTGSPVRTRSPYEVKEYHHPPSEWKVMGPAPADHVVHLQIGLRQERFGELERHLGEGMCELSLVQLRLAGSVTRTSLITFSGSRFCYVFWLSGHYS